MKAEEVIDGVVNWVGFLAVLYFIALAATATSGGNDMSGSEWLIRSAFAVLWVLAFFAVPVLAVMFLYFSFRFIGERVQSYKISRR